MSEAFRPMHAGAPPVDQHIPPVPPPPDPRGAPITWSQFWGSLANEYLSPPVMIAFLTSMANWLATPESFTAKAIIQGVILAIIAALEAVKSATGSSALQLRLKARGQLRQ